MQQGDVSPLDLLLHEVLELRRELCTARKLLSYHLITSLDSAANSAADLLLTQLIEERSETLKAYLSLSSAANSAAPGRKGGPVSLTSRCESRATLYGRKRKEGQTGCWVVA